MPAQSRGGAEDVTVGEVNRNVVDLRKVMQEFISEVRTGYVRRDVYDAERTALTSYVELLVTRIDKAEDDLDEQQKKADEREKERVDRAAADRRLIFTAIFAPIVVAVVVAILLGQYL